MLFDVRLSAPPLNQSTDRSAAPAEAAIIPAAADVAPTGAPPRRAPTQEEAKQFQENNQPFQGYLLQLKNAEEAFANLPKDASESDQIEAFRRVRQANLMVTRIERDYMKPFLDKHPGVDFSLPPVS